MQVEMGDSSTGAGNIQDEHRTSCRTREEENSQKENKQKNQTQCQESVKKTGKPNERASHGKSWDDLNNKIRSIGL